MENSKQYLKDHGILPKISFNDGESRILTIIEDKIDKIFDSKANQNVDGMSYKVKEDGVVKKFFTSSITLIAKLSEIEKDTVVKIKQVKYKSADGFRKTYNVSKIEGENEIEVETPPDHGDIPIINDPPVPTE